MTQLDGHRSGSSYDPQRDYARLNAQAQDVWAIMRDGRWHTLYQISYQLGIMQTSASARLRDFRKARFGGHIVERRHIMRGTWEYRLIPNVEATCQQ